MIMYNTYLYEKTDTGEFGIQNLVDFNETAKGNSMFVCEAIFHQIKVRQTQK